MRVKAGDNLESGEAQIVARLAKGSQRGSFLGFVLVFHTSQEIVRKPICSFPMQQRPRRQRWELDSPPASAAHLLPQASQVYLSPSRAPRWLLFPIARSLATAART
jgi:hypothetical protein